MYLHIVQGISADCPNNKKLSTNISFLLAALWSHFTESRQCATARSLFFESVSDNADVKRTDDFSFRQRRRPEIRTHTTVCLLGLVAWLGYRLWLRYSLWHDLVTQYDLTWFSDERTCLFSSNVEIYAGFADGSGTKRRGFGNSSFSSVLKFQLKPIPILTSFVMNWR